MIFLTKTAKNIGSIFALAVLFFAFGNLAQAATFGDTVLYYPLDHDTLFEEQMTKEYANDLESILYTPAKFDYGAKSNGTYYYAAEATTTGTLLVNYPNEWVCVSFWYQYISAVDPYYDTILNQENISGYYSDNFSVNFKSPTGIANGIFIQMKWNDDLGNTSILENTTDLKPTLDDRNFHNIVICRQVGVNLGYVYIDGAPDTYTITNYSIWPVEPSMLGGSKYYIGGDYLFNNFLIDDLALTHGLLDEYQINELQTNTYSDVITGTNSTSSQIDLNLANVPCCANLGCRVPIAFSPAISGYDLTVSLDPAVCNAFEPGDDYTLDYFNASPAVIIFPAAAAGAHTACFVLSHGGRQDSVLTQTVNYYATTSPYCIPAEQHDFSFCADPCASIGTSSDYFYAIECGLKKTGCWLVVPFDDARDYISDSLNILKTKFPASIYFDLTSAFESGLTQTTDDRTQTLGIPMIRQTGTGSEFYILPVLDSSSTEHTIGKENATLFRNSQIWFIWIATAVFLIIFITRKK